MKVKMLKDTFWFRAGEVHDLDTELAKQMVALGDAKAVDVGEEKVAEPVKDNKEDKITKTRAKK